MSFWFNKLFVYGIISLVINMICNLCPRNCNAERDEYSGKGFCKMGTVPKIALAAPHYWEEPCISGKNGSGTVFFSGCTMKCVFCQNYEISSMGQGHFVTAKELSEIYRQLEEKGVHNINLVTATHFLDEIIKSFEIYMPSIPIVYNCGGYEKAETLKRLEGIVSVYLPDFKYGFDELGVKYSNAPNYVETTVNAIKEMVRQCGKPCYSQDNMIEKGVIVRHLILPNHTKSSIKVLEIIKETFNDDVLVSLMSQYIPTANADRFEKLNRKITHREYDKVLNVLYNLDLDGFAQKLSSADKKFVPKWDI